MSRHYRQCQGGRYDAAIDLRGHGFSSLLFLNSKPRGSDKLALIGVGAMSYERIKSEVGALFGTDIQALEIMRIDLAVDLFGYSVKWFKDNVCASRRSSRGEVGRLYRHTVRRGVETLYIGAWPNQFRIYDKIAQLEAEARRAKWQQQTVGTQRHAHGELLRQGVPLTRVERQYGGGKIPEQLATLGNLAEKAPTMNPFEPLEFLSGPTCLSIPADLGASQFLKCFGMYMHKQLHGYQATLAELNKRSKGKGKRLVRNIEALGGAQHTQPPDLLSLYRETLACQLDPLGHHGAGNTSPAVVSMEAGDG